MPTLAIPHPRPTLAPLRLRTTTLEFGRRAYIMGVVNVTPDSFSDGGHFFDPERAVEHALELVSEGADILDIGGESTRPGAEPVAPDEEIARVVPVIAALRARGCTAPISVDTYKAAVARRALEAGADIVNDISALGFDDAMARTVADTGAALVLMHIRKTPRDMQQDIAYDDVVDDLLAYFDERIARACDAGIAPERIVVDPGIGFGKTLEQNFRLLRELHRFTALGHPILLGTSRKSLIGAVTGKPADRRQFGTAATVAAGIWAGADIVRVHDVEQMRDVVHVAEAIAMPGAATRAAARFTTR